MDKQYIDADTFSALLHGSLENLRRHEDEVNDLNVFPIPDGDTGSNMLLTICGGDRATPDQDEELGSYARRVADGMLLSARGNSGVILSQFADGIAAGLSGVSRAGASDLKKAFLQGVKHAYDAVIDPTEGTVLTVVREASEYAAEQQYGDCLQYLEGFIQQARATLSRTPDMLPVLKKAGVVDSGGAGIVYLIEGAAAVLSGERLPDTEMPDHGVPAVKELDLDLFTEDSVLEFGYCTELLLRLQRSKTDIALFDVNVIKDYLTSVGDSIVCFQTGSIVKIHVHTKTPYMVLQFCQQYGEYLTVKIENMTLQHNNLPSDSKLADKQERKKYAVVAVASGEGIKQTFREMGANYIVDGGQSMNPSADDFIEAFDRVNADVVLVLPNNGNIILAAEQAAKLYKASEVHVIKSKNIGEGYAALTMLNTDLSDTDQIIEEMSFAMEGVVTACVSRCVREAEMDGFLLHGGQYIGFVGKEVISADNDRADTACMLADKLDFTDHEICIIIRGIDSEADEAERIADHIRKGHRDCEVFVIDGGQQIYSYIIIAE